MGDTTTVEELQERVRRINALLDDPHPGLFTWKAALCGAINDFCAWWLGNSVAQLAAVTAERDAERKAHEETKRRLARAVKQLWELVDE